MPRVTCICFPRRLAALERRVDEILARFSTSHRKDHAPHCLSDGEKKRVPLASPLILEPEVLLLDEATGALDPPSQGEVIRFLVDSKNSGRTIVTATHDLDIVEDIADYAFVLEEGRIVGEGATADILADILLLRQAGICRFALPVATANAPGAPS